MTHQSQPQSAPESPAPYGTETPRPRWIPVLWLVLYVAFFIFIAVLAASGARR